MQDKLRSANPRAGQTPHLIGVSAEELTLVTGGGIWNWIKSAAIWVKDHIYVDTKNRAAGYKGRF